MIVAQLCPTLCDPMDCSPPGVSVHGVLQQEYWSGLPFPPLKRDWKGQWKQEEASEGTSLAVQWLRLCSSIAGDTGAVLGWGPKSPYAKWHNQKKEASALKVRQEMTVVEMTSGRRGRRQEVPGK